MDKPEWPMVDCPKSGQKVPIWFCLGSFWQRREKCPEILEASVDYRNMHATVKCKARKRREQS